MHFGRETEREGAWRECVWMYVYMYVCMYRGGVVRGEEVDIHVYVYAYICDCWFCVRLYVVWFGWWRWGVINCVVIFMPRSFVGVCGRDMNEVVGGVVLTFTISRILE